MRSMLQLITDKEIELKKDNDKKVPGFFKNIDECADYCMHQSNPIKVTKALLVWSKQQKDKEQSNKALLNCVELICDKATKINDDQTLVLVLRVLTILNRTKGLIEKNQRYVWV